MDDRGFEKIQEERKGEVERRMEKERERKRERDLRLQIGEG